MTELTHRVRMWFRALFARRRADRDLAREMKSHIEMEREHLIRQGIAPDEADRRARIAFGGVQQFTEAVRDERGTQWLDNLVQDVRFALRQFARSPWVTAMVVAMLAIGIGANSVLFSFIDAEVFQPPAGVPSDASLVRIRGTSFSTYGEYARYMTLAELAEYRARTADFAAVAGRSAVSPIVSRNLEGEPISLRVQFVTSGFLGLLGVRPALGQLLPADGDTTVNSQPGVFISQRVWRELGGTPDVIGKSMVVGDAAVTIVGVAPTGFHGTEGSSEPIIHAWLPVSAMRAATGQNAVAERSGGFLAVARLQHGVSIARASVAVRAIGARAAESAPSTRRVTTASEVVPLLANNGGGGPRRNDASMAFFVVGAIAVLILAVICTNITALMLGRAATRQREIGVRLSLGATRPRLIRQMLTESTLLALAGAVLGLGLLAILIALMHRAEVGGLVIGWRALGATMAAALGTGVLVGLSPALHATRASVFDALKGSSAGASRVTLGQRQLVTLQIALSQPLLVGLGVLLAALVQGEYSKARLDTAAQTVVMELSPAGRYSRENSEANLRLAEQVRTFIAELPGVERVSNSTGWETSRELLVNADPAAGIEASAFTTHLRVLGTGYFDLLRTPMIGGREFDRTDVPGAPSAVVLGSDLAADLFGTANPVGRRFTCKGICSTKEYTIVGVVDATRAGPSLRAGRLYVYIPAAQYDNYSDPTILVRVRGDAATMLPVIRARMNAEFPAVPIARARTLAQIDEESRRESLQSGAAATAGGALALILAAIGLYGVVSFAVNQRTKEIGVRVALGARPAQIVRQFAREGVKLSLIGCALGLPASVLAIRALLSGLQYRGLNAWIVGAAIAALVTAIAMFATWLPARRAASVDPLTALRSE